MCSSRERKRALADMASSTCKCKYIFDAPIRCALGVSICCASDTPAPCLSVCLSVCLTVCPSVCLRAVVKLIIVQKGWYSGSFGGRGRPAHSSLDSQRLTRLTTSYRFLSEVGRHFVAAASRARPLPAAHFLSLTTTHLFVHFAGPLLASLSIGPFGLPCR